MLKIKRKEEGDLSILKEYIAFIKSSYSFSSFLLLSYREVLLEVLIDLKVYFILFLSEKLAHLLEEQLNHVISLHRLLP